MLRINVVLNVPVCVKANKSCSEYLYCFERKSLLNCSFRDFSRNVAAHKVLRLLCVVIADEPVDLVFG